MADEKQIIIGSDNVIGIMWGTGVKSSPDLSTSSTNTFSGAIVDGTDNIPYTIEVSRIRNDGMEQHMALSEKLDDMMKNGDDITVIDTMKPKGQDAYQVIDHYFNCLLEGNDFEMKTDELTAESLKFRASSKVREWKKV